MTPCPPELTLERFLAGELPPRDTSEIDLHVESCDSCQRWLEAAYADESLLEGLRGLDTPPDLAPLTNQIAGYRILEEIGRGGMGVVYAAEQDNPRRRVALKVIRPGMASARALRRFEHEAQALGRLQHPGIAQILEAGTFGRGRDAQPFFAMELVRGEALTQFARQKNLSVEKRLDLFAQVCDAVQHAHGKGVVHRDLKPANILVDDHGHARILDFGVARLQEDASEREEPTLVGQLVGTLSYMSPEQVHGDPDAVDTRTDVHSLGAILFELLTGRTPYDLADKTTLEAVRTITESDPIPLTHADRSLRGDLSTIVHKALAKDPRDRYPTAAELADEVRRFLRHEPIDARPPSTVYQLQKFARRHRAVVGGIAGIFVVLVAGIVTAVLLWQRAEDSATVALREAAEAESTREFLQEILSLASPTQRKGETPTVSEALDIAVKQVDELEDKPWIEAAIRHTIGRVKSDLGEHEEAERHLRRSLQLYQQLYGERHKKVAYVLTSLSDALFACEDFAGARAAAERALAMRGLLSTRHAVILGTVLLNAGKSAYLQGEQADAERYTRGAIAAYEEHDGLESINAAISRSVLATIVNRLGRAEESERLYRESIRRQKEFLGEDNLRVANTTRNFCRFLELHGRFTEAEPLRREVLSIRRDHYDDDHVEVGLAIQALGNTLCEMGRWKEGLPLIEKAMRTLESKLGEKHRRVTHCRSALGRGLLAAGRFDDALKHLRRARGEATESFGPHHDVTLRAALREGAALVRLKRFAAAEKVLRACHGAAVEHVPWAGHLVVECKTEWASALTGLGRNDEAARLLAARQR